jgi:hypothetical protein
MKKQFYRMLATAFPYGEKALLTMDKEWLITLFKKK